jgi:hypothetical protein
MLRLRLLRLSWALAVMLLLVNYAGRPRVLEMGRNRTLLLLMMVLHGGDNH